MISFKGEAGKMERRTEGEAGKMERRIEGEAGRKQEPGGGVRGRGTGRDREKEESSRNSIPRGVSDAQAAPACHTVSACTSRI